MPTLKCNNCGKEINNVPNMWDRNEKCINCNGYFSEIQQQGYSSISNQLNQIGQDIGNNIGSIPHIIIGKERKNPMNIKNPKLSIEDKGYEQYEKIRKWGLWIIISLVVGYAVYRIMFAILGI